MKKKMNEKQILCLCVCVCVYVSIYMSDKEFCVCVYVYLYIRRDVASFYLYSKKASQNHTQVIEQERERARQKCTQGIDRERDNPISTYIYFIHLSYFSTHPAI